MLAVRFDVHPGRLGRPLMAQNDETPKVLLFDLGGVLVQWDGIDALRELCPDRLEREAARRFWVGSPWVQRFERGDCTQEEFANAVVRELGLTVSPGEFLAEFETWVRAPLPGALELLESLRGRHVLACLSNTNATHWRRIRDDFGFGARLDRCYLSYDIRRVKPSAECFEFGVEDLGHAAGSVAFFDDNPECVEGARAVGLRAWIVRGVEELRDTLREIGCA